MKKLFFILGILFSLFTMPVGAEQTQAEVHQKNHGTILNGRERSPIYLPTIDILYEPNDRSIKVLSSGEWEVTVFLYDTSGNLVSWSGSMDAILFVPEFVLDKVHIEIESELWYAKAVVSL